MRNIGGEPQRLPDSLVTGLAFAGYRDWQFDHYIGHTLLCREEDYGIVGVDFTRNHNGGHELLPVILTMGNTAVLATMHSHAGEEEYGWPSIYVTELHKGGLNDQFGDAIRPGEACIIGREGATSRWPGLNFIFPNDLNMRRTHASISTPSHRPYRPRVQDFSGPNGTGTTVYAMPSAFFPVCIRRGSGEV